MKANEIIPFYKGFIVGDEARGKHARLAKMQHEKLHDMLTQMEVYLEEGQAAKFMQCLGFVQGVFWVAGCFPLDYLKEHNRGIHKEFEEE